MTEASFMCSFCERDFTRGVIAHGSKTSAGICAVCVSLCVDILAATEKRPPLPPFHHDADGREVSE